MMGGKKKYIEMFGSFTKPFNLLLLGLLLYFCTQVVYYANAK